MYVSGHRRFQYGGYWFGLVDPWPEYWSMIGTTAMTFTWITTATNIICTTADIPAIALPSVSICTNRHRRLNSQRKEKNNAGTILVSF